MGAEDVRIYGALALRWLMGIYIHQLAENNAT